MAPILLLSAESTVYLPATDSVLLIGGPEWSWDGDTAEMETAGVTRWEVTCSRLRPCQLYRSKQMEMISTQNQIH